MNRAQPPHPVLQQKTKGESVETNQASKEQKEATNTTILNIIHEG